MNKIDKKDSQVTMQLKIEKRKKETIIVEPMQVHIHILHIYAQYNMPIITEN